MKKKILFAVIALVTLLAFTGCDKILEFMFPDSTGGGDGGWGDNSIQVQVSVADPSIEWWNYTVWVELSVQNTDGTFTPVGEAYRSGSASVPFDDPEATPTAMFRYDGVPDGRYALKAWMDVNGNWGADAEDPIAQGHTDMGMTEFDLPFLDVYGNTFNEVWVFGELALPVDIGGGTPFLFVRDGLVQDANYTYYSFNLDSTVQWTSFQSISYDIYDPWGYWIYGSTSNGNYINADMTGWYTTLAAGTYTLSIWNVTDDQGNSVTPWQWNVPFQVVNTWSAMYGNGTLWPDVVNYTLSGAPFYVSNSRDVRLDFYNEINDFLGSYYVIGNYGWFEAWGVWNWQTPSWYFAGDGKMAGKVQIFVDATDNGLYDDAADVAAEVPIWVDSSTYHDGTYYLPYLNVDIGRFIPYVDFSRIYMMF